MYTCELLNRRAEIEPRLTIDKLNDDGCIMLIEAIGGCEPLINLAEFREMFVREQTGYSHVVKKYAKEQMI